jgi:hypothetical protein
VLFVVKLCSRIGPDEKYFMALLGIFFDLKRVIPVFTFADSMGEKDRIKRLDGLTKFFVAENHTMKPVIVGKAIN